MQVATKPCGSNISASSAPALVACIHARIQFIFEWLFSPGSCTSARPRRTAPRASRRAAVAPPPRRQRPSSPSPSQWARVQPQADDLSGRRRVQEDLYAPVCNHKTLWDGAYGRPFWHALPDCTSYKPPRNRLISTNQTPLCVPIRVAFGGRSRTARGPFLRRFFFCLPLGTGPTAGIVCFVAWVPLTVVRGSGPFTLYSSAVLRFA